MQSPVSPYRVARVPGSSAERSPVSPPSDIMADPGIWMCPLNGCAVLHPVKPGYRAAAYVIGGTGRFDEGHKDVLANRTMALFGDEGDAVGVRAGGEGVRFLFF